MTVSEEFFLPSTIASDAEAEKYKALGDTIRQLEAERDALAEQNEAMRKALYKLACLGNGDQFGNSIGNSIAQDALNLPNLAAEVLKRRDAETLRRAAEFFTKNSWWDVPARLRLMAAELEKETTCNPHPDAPHGFDRSSSHSLGRYVCECEGWEPEGGR